MLETSSGRLTGIDGIDGQRLARCAEVFRVRAARRRARAVSGLRAGVPPLRGRLLGPAAGAEPRFTAGLIGYPPGEEHSHEEQT